ncbi:MAG: hypothetical protein JSV40_05445, partial [Deltaproteobacteria bacterium]
MNSYHRKRTVCGVDFSGAQDAGKKIWIACGGILDDVILISECFPAKDLPGSGLGRDQAIRALRAFIRKKRDCVFGLDFPFGIPRILVAEENWEEWLRAFPERYTSPEGFKRQCHLASNGKELRRATDVETKTPFSPYNLRLYRQTYFGIRDVLGVLVQEKAVCVLPLQTPQDEKPWAIEICPAATLKTKNLNFPYKGRGSDRKAAREKILTSMEKTGVLKVRKTSVRKRIIEDRGGDALDSVIAGYATFKALNHGLTSETNAPYAIEGKV